MCHTDRLGIVHNVQQSGYPDWLTLKLYIENMKTNNIAKLASREKHMKCNPRHPSEGFPPEWNVIPSWKKAFDNDIAFRDAVAVIFLKGLYEGRKQYENLIKPQLERLKNLECKRHSQNVKKRKAT
jgi:hypothetical protein